jgi:hypothetical protein
MIILPGGNPLKGQAGGISGKVVCPPAGPILLVYHILTESILYDACDDYCMEGILWFLKYA